MSSTEMVAFAPAAASMVKVSVPACRYARTSTVLVRAVALVPE